MQTKKPSLTPCEMEHCIYNDTQANACTLLYICLDQNGMCKSCILPTIPNEIVEHYKDKLLQKLHPESN